ncbi:hypothetical protein U1Q18_007839 [Sarracenia purpurea var. burkii]
MVDGTDKSRDMKDVDEGIGRADKGLGQRVYTSNGGTEATGGKGTRQRRHCEVERKSHETLTPPETLTHRRQHCSPS